MVDKVYRTESSLINFSSHKQASHKIHIEKGRNKMDDNELVIMQNDQPVTTSLKVAKVFHKDHKHVLEAIRNLTAQNSAVKSLVAVGTYKNSRNQKQKMYYLNRDGFSLVVMGFTGKKALQFKLDFIHQFNKMEQIIKSGKLSKRDKAFENQIIASQKQTIENYKTKVNQLQEKLIASYEVQLSNSNSQSQTTNESLAKAGLTAMYVFLKKYNSKHHTGYTVQGTFQYLRNWHILGNSKKNGTWNKPIGKYKDQNLFNVQIVTKNGSTYPATRLTNQGSKFVTNILNSLQGN